MSNFVFKRKRKDKNGITHSSKYYYGRICLADENKNREFSLKTTDKQIARDKLRKIELSLEREKLGIIPPENLRKGIKTPLIEMLPDLISELETINRNSRYIKSTESRIKRILKECNWKTFPDISEDGFLNWRSKKNLGAKALNDYLASISQFLKWLKRKKRIPFNPLEDVQKIDGRGKEKRLRRALTEEEFKRLLNSCPERRLVYLIAAYTGLRQGELEQLVWSDIRLSVEKPHILARASTTKNRKDAVIPLHRDVIKELVEAIPARGAEIDGLPVFENGVPRNRRYIKDLENAGISYIDSSGRSTPFHALRNYFATIMARNGTPSRLIQELMRHSESRLTEKIYTDASQLPTFDAVNALPSLASSEATEDSKSSNGPQYGPQNPVKWSPKLSRAGRKLRLRREPQAADHQQSSLHTASSDTNCQMVGAKGFELSAKNLQSIGSQYIYKFDNPICTQIDSQRIVRVDPELARLVMVWNSLPESRKLAIKAILGEM